MSRQPQIIQGGLGVAVSSWGLSGTVARLGQLGVVSGTALDLVLARRLQFGDPAGDIRRAVSHFPDQALADRIMSRFFVEGGKPADQAFVSVPMYTADPKRRSNELAVLAGYVEVFLAKEGHDGPIGINFLEKIQLPTPATLYGALLAGVDYVLVGAGIPRAIPGLLDKLSAHEAVELSLHVAGVEAGESYRLRFDPREVMADVPPPLPRPTFLAIIASHTLAISLTRHTQGVNGFVIEGPTAGGHNAPPRGQLVLEGGEPVYGPRDEVDLEKIRAIGLPFWLAGGQATPERLQEALREGAAGIQVGTAFAFCEESGMSRAIRERVIEHARNGGISVFTDPLASPTGFPFKVVQLEDTLAQDTVYEARERRCDAGYLRELYKKDDGSLGYRCPAEPVEDFLRKGGELEETKGRKCVCNGLLSTVDIGQLRAGEVEPAIVTAGDDVKDLLRFMPNGTASYTAADVIEYLLGTSVR